MAGFKAHQYINRSYIINDTFKTQRCKSDREQKSYETYV